MGLSGSSFVDTASDPQDAGICNPVAISVLIGELKFSDEQKLIVELRVLSDWIASVYTIAANTQFPVCPIFCLQCIK